MSKRPKPQVTLKNVKSFFAAHSRIVYDKFVGLPPHIKEQVEYRHSLCQKDCFVPDDEGKTGCIYCGCNPFDKAFATRSCNDGERFPDLMNEKQWSLYKSNLEAKKKQQ